MSKFKFLNKFYGIVLARKNSKRIKNKNIRKFKNKPLIEWTFNEAEKSKFIDKILCSTDDERIINQYQYRTKIDFPYKRPSYLAKSKTSSEETLLHLLKYYYKKKNYLPKYFILLQPTSPMRKKIHIDDSIKKFLSNKSSSLISIVKINNVYEKKFGTISKLDNSYKFNGAIYIINTSIFMKSHKLFYNKKTIYYEMDLKSSLDIDFEYQII